MSFYINLVCPACLSTKMFFYAVYHFGLKNVKENINSFSFCCCSSRIKAIETEAEKIHVCVHV